MLQVKDLKLGSGILTGSDPSAGRGAPHSWRRVSSMDFRVSPVEPHKAWTAQRGRCREKWPGCDRPASMLRRGGKQTVCWGGQGYQQKVACCGRSGVRLRSPEKMEGIEAPRIAGDGLRGWGTGVGGVGVDQQRRTLLDLDVFSVLDQADGAEQNG